MVGCGRLETDNNQNAPCWSNGQPDPHIDEHQLKNCFCGMAEFIQTDGCTRSGSPEKKTHTHGKQDAEMYCAATTITFIGKY